MLLWIIIVGIIGLILLIAEALIPGFGVFGIAGSVLLFGSIVAAGIQYGFAVFLIMIAFAAILILLFIRFAKTKKIYDKVVLKDSLNTKDFDESILQGIEGEKGITITTVQPYGKIQIDNKQIDVCSEGGYIEKNKMVEVIRVTGKTVVVKEI